IPELGAVRHVVKQLAGPVQGIRLSERVDVLEVQPPVDLAPLDRTVHPGLRLSGALSTRQPARTARRTGPKTRDALGPAPAEHLRLSRLVSEREKLPNPVPVLLLESRGTRQIVRRPLHQDAEQAVGD